MARVTVVVGVSLALALAVIVPLDGNLTQAAMVTGLTENSGALVQTYTYDALGHQHVTGTIANPFTFAGRECDSQSGLYYDRARYYDPASGRFISEDPLRSTNRYEYAENAPTNFTDPTGLQATVEYVEEEEAL